MQLSLVATIFLLCVVKFTRPFEDEDEDFDEEVDFADRMDQLKEICAEEGFIRFNKFYYEDFLKWSSRNYSFLLLFVALADHQQCDSCKMAVDEFAILAKSLLLAPGLSDQLFLGVVDYDQTPEIFVRQLIRSIPSVALVAADQKLIAGQAVPQMDTKLGFSAEAISEWLAANANLHFEIIRPPNYKPLYALLVIILTIGSLLLFAWKKWQSIVSFWSSTLAGLIAMVFCLLMVSGHMFNRIHSTPLFHVSERGISVMSRESHYQYVYETYLIGAMYLCFGGCVIVVVERGKGKNSVGNAKAAAALLFAALFYSCIVSSFRFKMDVYPYSGLVNMEKYF